MSDSILSRIYLSLALGSRCEKILVCSRLPMSHVTWLHLYILLDRDQMRDGASSNVVYIIMKE
jgi:hypothetical protein